MTAPEGLRTPKGMTTRREGNKQNDQLLQWTNISQIKIIVVVIIKRFHPIPIIETGRQIPRPSQSLPRLSVEIPAEVCPIYMIEYIIFHISAITVSYLLDNLRSILMLS